MTKATATGHTANQPSRRPRRLEALQQRPALQPRDPRPRLHDPDLDQNRSDDDRENYGHTASEDSYATKEEAQHDGRRVGNATHPAPLAIFFQGLRRDRRNHYDRSTSRRREPSAPDAQDLTNYELSEGDMAPP